MRFLPLQSGSSGNAVYVETSAGLRLLVDAGLSGRQAELRLAAVGVDIRSIDAVVISHDHRDHIASAGIFHRKFGLPIIATKATLRAGSRHRLGEIADLRLFAAGDCLKFGTARLETIPTPHDGVDGVAFVVDDGRRRLGVLTDLGHAFDGLDALLASLNAVLLESNYDAGMLSKGNYPPALKRRIRGNGGHLSNDEAAELLAGIRGDRLQWACLGHLSADNNLPEVALQTAQRRVGQGFPLHLASRFEAGPMLEVA